MSPHVLGAIVAVLWLELGVLMAWLILNKTTLLNNVRMNHGLTADKLRRHFWILPLFALIGGTIVGWQGGPVLFGDQS